MGQRFEHRIRVRFSDCDPQGVLFYANHLEYFDVAVTELFREATDGYGEMIESGVDMVVAEASIRFHSAVCFDDEVTVSISITRLGRTGMTSGLAISRDGETLSEGELRHVFVETAAGDKTEIPAGVRLGLEPFLAAGP